MQDAGLHHIRISIPEAQKIRADICRIAPLGEFVSMEFAQLKVVQERVMLLGFDSPITEARANSGVHRCADRSPIDMFII